MLDRKKYIYAVILSKSFATEFIDDFRLYNSTLTPFHLANISSLLNPYILCSTAVNTTGYKLYKNGIDFCNMYSPYSSGNHFNTYDMCDKTMEYDIMHELHFSRWKLTI